MDTEERNEFIYKELDGTPDKFIWSIITDRKYDKVAEKLPTINDDDLFQEGWIALITAANKYSAEKGGDFVAYAYYGISRHIRQVIRKNVEVYNSEAPLRESIGEGKEYEKDVRVEQMMEALSKREQKILKKYGEGHTQEEIAKELGVTQPRVHQIIAEIREKAN